MQRRHETPGCWCGSGHDWVLAKHGVCPCFDPHCGEVHARTVIGSAHHRPRRPPDVRRVR